MVAAVCPPDSEKLMSLISCATDVGLAKLFLKTINTSFCPVTKVALASTGRPDFSVAPAGVETEILAALAPMVSEHVDKVNTRNFFIMVEFRSSNSELRPSAAHGKPHNALSSRSAKNLDTGRFAMTNNHNHLNTSNLIDVKR